MEFLGALASAAPDLRDQYENMEALYSKKLWHQLTLTLDDFLSNKANSRGNNFKQLYIDFVSKFETRLDNIRLAVILSKIGFNLPTPQESYDFFVSFVLPKPKFSADATLCLEMDIAITKLKLGNVAEVKTTLEETTEKLQASIVKETVVLSKFYKASGEYRKVVGPAQEFYRIALMYLTYTAVETLDPTERYELATDIALAAICGEGVYNLGEVIVTPILSYLRGTPNAWLQDIILALYKGDILTFNRVIDAHQAAYFAHAALSSHHESIKKKAVLLCVLNIAFDRAPHDRMISFTEIASKAIVPLDQVEWILMRALSIGIIKGSIDEVEQFVSVTWVQPRVLDLAQLGEVSNQIKGWTDRVKATLNSVQDQTPELYF